jgi:hypothetical protein
MVKILTFNLLMAQRYTEKVYYNLPLRDKV